MASVMYSLQPSPSRTSAPRGVYRLWSVPEQFSAMQSAACSTNRKFISAGASVSGVSWNSTVRPSISSTVPVSVIDSVGATRPGVPVGTVTPMPGVHVPARTARQLAAEHVLRPAGHGGPGDHVLANGGVEEARRAR